mmetsp:Transcript_33544/g.60142  ORF Transcript_33544/g.60142 Transcript_33544/m.60142 type:complete len:311 (+) Transcript_33544:1145-2077(+)
MHGVQSSRNRGDGSLQGSLVTKTGVSHGRNNLLVNHVNHAESLHLDNAGVVVKLDGSARLAFRLCEHVVSLKQLNILAVNHPVRSLDTAVDLPNTPLDSLLGPLSRVAVSVEDAPPVLVEGLRSHSLRSSTSLDGISESLETVSSQCGKNSVHNGDVLGRTDGTELEASTTIGERRSTVAVLGRHSEGGNRRNTNVHHFAAGLVRTSLAVLESLHEVGDIIAKVCGNDSRGSLARTQTEIVTRAGDGHTHKITVHINGANQRGQDHREDFTVAGVLLDLGRVQQVGTAQSSQTPVVVLSTSVNVLERLLL